MLWILNEGDIHELFYSKDTTFNEAEDENRFVQRTLRGQ